MEGLVITLTTEGKQRLEQAVVSKLTNEALKQGVVTNPADLVIRDMLPDTDLNNADMQWSQSGKLASYAWTMMYSGQNPESKLFAVYGVFNELATATSGPAKPAAAGNSSGIGAIPPVLGVKFLLGNSAKVKDLWHIQRIYAAGDEGFVETPVIYNKKETFRIQMYARESGSPAAFIGLIGKVAEPKGEQIMGAS